ncbi:MAG: T9SS type A sorting domain-containing protein [FCB group bacterium]|nr:T9SS type A sorting domain-containing protein [FCB group bacterium]
MEVVSRFDFKSVYPNPFNPVTTLSFDLPEAGYVSLVVYDIQGREAAALVDGQLSSGEHQAVFDGSDLASGIYFARLDNGKMQITQKLLLIK